MSTATAPKVEKKTYSLGKITVPVIDLDDARKPAYAWVGVADLLLEQAKDVPSDVKARTEKVQADVQARAKKLQSSIPTQVKELPTQVKDLPTTLKELPGKTVTSAKELPSSAVTSAKKARTTTQERVSAATDKATARYADLAARGEKLVTKIRRQQATQDAIAEGKRAVQKAEAAANNAKRAAKSAAKATTDAAGKVG